MVERAVSGRRGWAANQEFVAHVETLLVLEMPAHQPDSGNVYQLSPSQTWIRNYFESRIKRHDALGIFVISPNRSNIASMRDANLGTRNLIATQRPERLDKVFLGEGQLVPPIHSDVPLPDRTGKRITDYPTMFVLTPIRDNTGGIIAALAIRLDPYDKFSDIPNTGHIGESLETYLFDSHRRIITDTRLIHDLREKGGVPVGTPSILGVEFPDMPGPLQDLIQMADSAIATLTGAAWMPIRTTGESLYWEPGTGMQRWASVLPRK